MIDYTIIRSRRRTAAIHIKDGKMEVRVPMKMSKRDIDRFISSKKEWIAKHLAQSIQNAARRSEFRLDYGGTALLYGDEYPLIASEKPWAGGDGEWFRLPPDLTPEQIKQEVVSIYRHLADIVIPYRVAYYAGLMGISPSAVKISNAKSRWGSCSAKGSLNFSWRLMMADEAVIDYVIVHELSHMFEMNHSARFWSVIESVLPDYKERRKQLRELQRRLSGEDWGRV